MKSLNSSSNAGSPWELQAWRSRYLFSLQGPPIVNALLQTSGGAIQTIRNAATTDESMDLGNAAIIPPLVNAHTHLEFSDCPQPLGSPGEPLPNWIRRIVQRRREAAAACDDLARVRDAAVASGLAESTAAGVAMMGEIATQPWSYEPWRTASLESVIFLELLGLAPQRQEALLLSAQTHLDPAGPLAQRHRPGLSPHAPYTASLALTEKACQLSAAHGCPVAMHLAESREELELLQTGRGAFRDLLVELGAWQAGVFSQGMRPIDYLHALDQASRALVIHGNYLDDEEIAFLAQRREKMAVVFCPRTHAYFQHARYRLPEMLAKGVRVALGTDSRGSNPDLNLWSEAQLVRQSFPEAAPKAILEMATTAGAAALGAPDCSLRPGGLARFTVVDLPDDEAADPYALLLDPRSRVRGLVDAVAIDPGV